MKFRTLAIMAAAAILSTQTYAAPTTLAADDTGSSMSGNVGNPNADDMPNASTQANNDMMPGSPAGMGSNGNPTPSDSSNSNDDMSADTATGDDDY